MYKDKSGPSGKHKDEDTEHRRAAKRSTYKKATARAKISFLERVGVFDFETDPFDGENAVWPFLATVHRGENYEDIILWKEPEEKHLHFMQRFIDALKAIPDSWIFYAHNGGRFDMKFLLRFFRGGLNMKGASTIMEAKVGEHKLRDSLHIIPAPLSAWNKDSFNYDYMKAENRDKYRNEIIPYCVSDCKNAYTIVRAFLQENGNKISIGQASFTKLRLVYPSVARITEHMDGLIRGIDTNYRHKETYGQPNGRGFFMGGRVECFAGKGVYNGHYKLYDVNSMYPYVMASMRHPIGGNFSVHRGPINPNTCFVRVRCKSNGAFLRFGPNGLTGEHAYGEFNVTIHEWNTATSLPGLVSDAELLECVDCDLWSDFSDFIVPMYNGRQEVKAAKEAWTGPKHGPEWDQLVLRDLFLKFYLNNAYGKFAQNPRKFRNIVYMDIDEEPDFDYTKAIEYGGEMPFKVVHKRTDGKWNEERQCYDLRTGENRLRFYNVATGASITGAARAYLLLALYHSVNPIYCDTDSLICSSLGHTIPIDQTRLGAWKCEKELSQVLIGGKKTYAYTDLKGKQTVKCKGANGVSYDDFDRIIAGKPIAVKNKGVTFRDDGTQFYLLRQIVATAQEGPTLYAKHHMLRQMKEAA
jgi:DNA polymerase elongation subunit (family B)